MTKTNKQRKYHFDDDLRLKEVDILGKVQRVLTAVAYHVSVKHIVGSFEHSDQMC